MKGTENIRSAIPCPSFIKLNKGTGEYAVPSELDHKETTALARLVNARGGAFRIGNNDTKPWKGGNKWQECQELTRRDRPVWALGVTL